MKLLLLVAIISNNIQTILLGVDVNTPAIVSYKKLVFKLIRKTVMV